MKIVKALGLAVSSILLFCNVASSDETLDKIRANGKAVVATEAALEPWEFVQDNKIVGFGPDLLVEVVKDLGIKVEQLDLPFQGILAGLAAGQYDFIASTLTINAERAKLYGFTRPIGAGVSFLIVPAENSEIASPDNLVGKLVGTQLGSSEETKLRQYREKLLADGKGDLSDIRYFQSFTDVLFALQSGQIDAAVAGDATFYAYDKRKPGELKNVGVIGDPTFVAWVTRAEDVDLRAAINSTITRLVDSGELGKMQEKWFGYRMDTPATGYLPEGSIK